MASACTRAGRLNTPLGPFRFSDLAQFALDLKLPTPLKLEGEEGSNVHPPKSTKLLCFSLGKNGNYSQNKNMLFFWL